jgi:carbonic anhydrase/acetyltransferase-like protein (isoleucine patch superfamily)
VCAGAGVCVCVCAWVRVCVCVYVGARGCACVRARANEFPVSNRFNPNLRKRKLCHSHDTYSSYLKSVIRMAHTARIGSCVIRTKPTARI